MTVIEDDNEALGACLDGMRLGHLFQVTEQLIIARRQYFPLEKVFAIRCNCIRPRTEDCIINLIYPNIG